MIWCSFHNKEFLSLYPAYNFTNDIQIHFLLVMPYSIIVDIDDRKYIF